jgi:hypothetical protein
MIKYTLDFLFVWVVLWSFYAPFSPFVWELTSKSMDKWIAILELRCAIRFVAIKLIEVPRVPLDVKKKSDLDT